MADVLGLADLAAAISAAGPDTDPGPIRTKLEGRECWCHYMGQWYRLGVIPDHLTVDEWQWLFDPDATL